MAMFLLIMFQPKYPLEPYMAEASQVWKLLMSLCTSTPMPRRISMSQPSASFPGPPPAALPLATLAIEEARELVAHWLANLLPARSEEQPFTLAEGFLALYLCDAPMRWPGAFLNPQQAPPDFAETLQARLVKTGPELEISSMVPRPLDFGLLPDLAESAFDTLDRVPLIKTLLGWALFVAMLVFLFWYTRR